MHVSQLFTAPHEPHPLPHLSHFSHTPLKQFSENSPKILRNKYKSNSNTHIFQMGLFEELTVPTRFNRLRKYFDGLGMYDLDPTYPYTTLVADADKLLMLVFCNKYICTPEYIRRVLDQENLEETIKTFELIVKKRGEELEVLQEKLDETEALLKMQGSAYWRQISELRKKLDDETVAKHDLQYKHNSLANTVQKMCEQFGTLVVDEDGSEKLLESLEGLCTFITTIVNDSPQS